MRSATFTALALSAFLAAGARAADSGAPKASTLDYARVCAAMGPGFTNLPGTEVCVRISGYVKTGTSFGHTDASPLPAPPLPRIHLPN